MKSIQAEWVRYNANSNNKSVGDCVKRALSFAYGVDYDEISRQLNRIKREIGGDAYNDRYVWKRFLYLQGAVQLNKSDTGMTEEKFSELHPTGLYILLTGPANKDYSSHLVCVLNGDIIDSWNSSGYKVNEAWEIKDRNLDIYEVTYEDVIDELNVFIDEYVESVNKKYSDWFILRHDKGYGVNDTTYRMWFSLETQRLPDDSEYYSHRKHTHAVVIKVNPRMDVQQNIDSLKPKLKQKVYDWIYPYEKDRKDTLAIQNLEVHQRYPGYASYKKELLKLPEWVRKYVTDFWVNPKPDSGYTNYDLTFDPLPGDPRAETNPNVGISADTLSELKYKLEKYKKDYSRDGFDY